MILLFGVKVGNGFSCSAGAFLLIVVVDCGNDGDDPGFSIKKDYLFLLLWVKLLLAEMLYPTLFLSKISFIAFGKSSPNKSFG